MKVRLVSRTQVSPGYVKYLLEEANVPEEFKDVIENPEGLIAYIARVSSPNQSNLKYAGLIKYCMTHGHWSILEQSHATFEIETTRAISPQILRHRSFSFQEFSQRYSEVSDDGIEIYEARSQDYKNRQSSHDDLPEGIKEQWRQRQQTNWDSSYENYRWALENNIAKECARVVLPLQTKTRLFMSGTLRSFVHYIQVRADASTQKEHRDIANAIQALCVEEFPIIAEAAGWGIKDESSN